MRTWDGDLMEWPAAIDRGRGVGPRAIGGRPAEAALRASRGITVAVLVCLPIWAAIGLFVSQLS
jgi:hypothetical protein